MAYYSRYQVHDEKQAYYMYVPSRITDHDEQSDRLTYPSMLHAQTCAHVSTHMTKTKVEGGWGGPRAVNPLFSYRV